MVLVAIFLVLTSAVTISGVILLGVVQLIRHVVHIMVSALLKSYEKSWSHYNGEMK
jgi:hypothetical protein